MENFIVSARKYRPATFDTVVGQQSITSTLKNAIKTSHLAQAFLFCGPRGVGKTTCARILAKTINCFSISENIEACDECESCKSFNEGHSLNIYELDAASNNSVEDIRNLIEQVRFAPQLGTHKVYIIDEVHMLSQAAFNAFLKTLEEPPKHAIFILATTEKHKILPTILSRCQIFDFNRIQIVDIAGHLTNIAAKENITAEQDALHIIAQKADGALRDALSIFDQVVSFSGNNISYENVIENLNILDYDYYFKLTQAIFEKNISDCLLLFNEILDKGFDGHNFINGLAEHFRNLLVCQDGKTIELLEVGNNIREKYKEQASQGDNRLYIQFLDIISKADINYKSSKNHRLLVEIMLMQLCSSSGATEKKKPIINLPKRRSAKAVSSKTMVKPTSPSITERKTPITSSPLNQSAGALDQSQKITTQPTAKSPVLKKPMLKNVSFSDSISIKGNGTKKKEEEKAEIETPEIKTERPTEAFTQEAFLTLWKKYKSKLSNEGKLSLSSVFESTPSIDNESINILINNKALEDEFNAIKTEVLGYFRENLRNYNLSISTELNENPQTKRAYTPQEKFVKMSEKNPAIIDLAKSLNADVGYPEG